MEEGNRKVRMIERLQMMGPNFHLWDAVAESTSKSLQKKVSNKGSNYCGKEFKVLLGNLLFKKHLKR